MCNCAPIEVVEQFFSAREQRELLNSLPFDRSSLFLQYWTLKEAYIKTRGLGFSIPLDQFSLYKNTEGGNWRIACQPLWDENPERWRFWSWQVSSDHQGGFAIDRSVLVQA
jgi:4'-phosphopantetheinyl transferase